MPKHDREKREKKKSKFDFRIGPKPIYSDFFEVLFRLSSPPPHLFLTLSMSVSISSMLLCYGHLHISAYKILMETTRHIIFNEHRNTHTHKFHFIQLIIFSRTRRKKGPDENEQHESKNHTIAE